MSKVSLIIDVPSEKSLKPFFDIWDDCKKEIENILSKRLGNTDFSISVGYSALCPYIDQALNEGDGVYRP
jgi:hypothetical protein